MVNKLGKYLLLPAFFNFVVVIALIFSGVGIKIIFPIIFFILFISGTIVNILMPPIYTILSEKTETILTGKTFPTSIKQIFKDLARAIVIALRNTSKQLILSFFCLLLNFIPVIGSIVSLILIFIINVYYLGSGFMDYTYERWRYSAKDCRSRTYQLKYLAFTNGALYSLPLYMLCGTFIATFIGCVSTIAATISQLELDHGDNI